MDMFLGETSAFWIRVRAAMRKARIETPEQLEDQLRVTPPIYEVSQDGERWQIIERRPRFGVGPVVGWASSKEDAERIATALRRRELDFAA